MSFCEMENLGILIVCFVLSFTGICKGEGISKDLYRCRQMCYTRFIQDWHRCMDYDECKSMCITPPNINNYIPPEAFSFLCWNSCDENLGPFSLSVISTSRQGSLMLVDISWDQAIASTSKQCLVTWEVSGGGLMGNLLTDSPSVELSLWADTTYNIQVTCRNKDTNKMRRSYQLHVDTKTFNIGSSSSSSVPTIPSSSSSAIPIIALGANTKKLDDDLFETETSLTLDTEDRLRILKDSSKDQSSSIIDETLKIISPTTKTSTSKSETTITTEKHSDYHNIPSVIRSKLLKSDRDPIEIYLRNMFYVTLGLLGILLGVFFIYFTTRSTKDKLSSSGVDKEELIRKEVYSDTRTLHV